MKIRSIKKRKNNLTLEQRRENWGYAFILPWIVGVTVFFLIPLIQSFWYAFCDVSFSDNGLEKKFVGLKNFNIVFFESPTVFQKFTDSITQMLTELVLILTISFILSIILNQNFVGKTLARAIFSLPLIVSTGVLLSIFKSTLFSQSQFTLQESTMFQAAGLQELLEGTGFGQNFINTVIDWVNQLVDMLWKSGVQIIIFLSGIQSIPPSYYEVCDIEGATSWQRFWQVTFPIMMPFCLLNVVYTIIDSFTYAGNPVMSQILTYFKNIQYSLSNALALAYFLVVMVITGLIAALISRRIVYIDK